MGSTNGQELGGEHGIVQNLGCHSHAKGHRSLLSSNGNDCVDSSLRPRSANNCWGEFLMYVNAFEQ